MYAHVILLHYTPSSKFVRFIAHDSEGHGIGPGSAYLVCLSLMPAAMVLLGAKHHLNKVDVLAIVWDALIFLHVASYSLHMVCHD